MCFRKQMTHFGNKDFQMFCVTATKRHLESFYCTPCLKEIPRQHFEFSSVITCKTCRVFLKQPECHIACLTESHSPVSKQWCRGSMHSFTHPAEKWKNVTVSMGFLSALLNCSHPTDTITVTDLNGYFFLLLSSADLCCASIHPPNSHTLILSRSLTRSLSLSLSVIFRPPASDAAVGKKQSMIPLYKS